MPEETDAPVRRSPSREALELYACGFNTSQMARALSATLSFPEPVDRVLVRVEPVLSFHRGGLGSSAINGGILAAVFDFVIGTTAALVDPTKRSATMQLSMTFERPVLGDWFTAEAWIDRAGTATLFASAAIKDARGEICTRCSGMVKMSQQDWSPEWQSALK